MELKILPASLIDIAADPGACGGGSRCRQRHFRCKILFLSEIRPHRRRGARRPPLSGAHQRECRALAAPRASSRPQRLARVLPLLLYIGPTPITTCYMITAPHSKHIKIHQLNSRWTTSNDGSKAYASTSTSPYSRRSLMRKCSTWTRPSSSTSR